ERGEPTTVERVGAVYKETLTKPGPWGIYMYMQGETIPRETNTVSLHPTQKDQWGIPLLVTSVGYDDKAKEMLGVAGCKDVEVHDNHWHPGLDIHEMGGARMGADPKKSLLNKFNQLHACKDVFVTDGACMTSTGNQSPSILYMTLTARAVDHATQEMGRQNL